jgi:ATP-binding cassette subfamily B protein
MTASLQGSPEAIATIAPFNELSKEGRRRLEASISLVRFREGEMVSPGDTVGDRILVVLEGEARLLGERDGRPFTLERLGAGAIIGLASLLRAEGCEAVSAATALVAGSIPDAVMLELLQSEPALRSWCASQVWTAELHALLQSRDSAHAGAPSFDPGRWRTRLERLRGSVRAVEIPTNAKPPALAANEHWVLASANVPELAIGSRLEAGAPLPRPRPPLALRLLAVRDGATDPDEPRGSNEDGEGGRLATATPALAVEQAPSSGASQPTSLDLGGGDRSRGLQLVRARGTLEETLACFQMLGQMLDLPYRRDAIDKVLRDKLRRGLEPDLQLCGQIAAMLGLLVTGAKVTAGSATRLITPCLIPWKDSFAVVTASNAAGLRLASPSDGWVQLKPAQIAELYPEGLELLLFERSIATPDQTFGPGWFWPALKRYRGMLLQVLVASFVVQLFSLANPLLIQVIIDKVISQRSLDTLQILGMALVVVTLMEGVIGSLRTFLFTDTTNRIDLRLGAEVIDHLLRLPLGYFDRRPVGELGTRIAELEKIRNFLTGQALMTLLDAAFSVIYIIVMALYSWMLTILDRKSTRLNSSHT